MRSMRITEARDVGKQVPTGIFRSGVDPMLDTFGFEDVEEVRVRGIVPAPGASNGLAMSFISYG